MFEELVFDGVLENVVLLLAEGEGGCDHFRLHHVSDEDELLHGLLDSPTRVSTSGRATGKWTDLILVDPSVRALQARHVDALCTRLDTYGRPTLGVVTGANRFFALRPSEVRARSIPLQQLVPITPPGHRRPRGRAFTKGDWLALAEADEPVHLLRVRGPVDRGPVAQLIVEVTLPPATPGPPQHVHREHDETFVVVAGTTTFTCGSETIQATPGMLVTVPPHTAHTFANDGNVESVLLCTVTPDRYIGYFRELATLPPGRPDPAAIGAIMSRYATDIVRPPT